MSAIQLLRERLARYPTVRFTATPTTVEVHPQDASGFSLRFIDQAPRFVVHFAGWHEHFTNQDEALDCFAFGLSESCRLEVTYRGSTPVRWQLEALQEGFWVPSSVTGLLLTPFWRSKRVVHLQNHLIQ